MTGLELYELQMAAKNGDILPRQELSYVCDDKGGRRAVYFNDKSGVFASIRITAEDPAFYLDIRRPLVVDCTGLANVDIPDMPDEADGIIFVHCGNTEGMAYVVRSEDQVADIENE